MADKVVRTDVNFWNGWAKPFERMQIYFERFTNGLETENRSETENR